MNDYQGKRPEQIRDSALITRITIWGIIVLMIILFFTRCSTTYLIEKATGNEYVLLKELPLKPIDRFLIHWKTMPDSPFAKFDSRTGKYFYLKTYDYAKELKSTSTDSITDNISKRWAWSKRLFWILLGCSVAFLLIIAWHQQRGNDKDDDDGNNSFGF